MKKIGLSILALILIAGIIYAGYFFLEEKRVKDYSTACMDKVREEIGNEYLGNIALIDSEKVDGVYHYFGMCSNETSDYYFSCAVTNKDNVDVKIEVDEVPDDFDGCNNYFDGCNRCSMQDDGEIVCTELACEEYQEAYCADEQYSESLEDIKSKAQPQRINDYPEETPEEANVLDITDKAMDAEYLINLTIGDKTFDVVLENNSSTRALYEKLKEGYVVINAKEYGGFEKVGSLGFDLPREDRQITTEAGDIVLYNGNQISLFYDSNSWSYTKLGKVMNKESLKEALGDGDITLTFSLKKIQ